MQTDHQTDRPTDWPTDRRTLSHIELLSQLKRNTKYFKLVVDICQKWTTRRGLQYILYNILILCNIFHIFHSLHCTYWFYSRCRHLTKRDNEKKKNITTIVMYRAAIAAKNSITYFFKCHGIPQPKIPLKKDSKQILHTKYEWSVR